MLVIYVSPSISNGHRAVECGQVPTISNAAFRISKCYNGHFFLLSQMPIYGICLEHAETNSAEYGTLPSIARKGSENLE